MNDWDKELEIGWGGYNMLYYCYYYVEVIMSWVGLTVFMWQLVRDNLRPYKSVYMYIDFKTQYFS